MAQGKISVIRTDSGNYNVIGIDNNTFILQGNLTQSQLVALINAAAKALAKGRS